MNKRILSILLAVLMLVSMIPGTALTSFAASAAPANNVAFYIGNTSVALNSETGFYLVNNQPSQTGTLGVDGCTAHLDSATGILTLHNYSGGSIYTLGSGSNHDLIVKLIGNNTITTDRQFGLCSDTNITITSTSEGSLTINSTKSSGNMAGISANFSGSGDAGSVIIGGNANITLTATNTTTGDYVYGVFAYKSLEINDAASLAVSVSNPNCTNSNRAIALCVGSGSGRNITFNTTGDVTLDTTGTGSLSYTMKASAINLVNVGTLTLKFKKSGLFRDEASTSITYDSNSFTETQSDTTTIATSVYSKKVAPPTYAVSIINGSATPSGAQEEGTEITLTANAAPKGKEFDRWVVSGATVKNENSATTTFTMPANSVSAEATYKDIIYNIKVNNGEARVSGGTPVTTATYGTPITLFAEATRGGAPFSHWVVNSGTVSFNPDETYIFASFIMPDEPVEITAVYEDIPEIFITTQPTGGTFTEGSISGNLSVVATSTPDSTMSYAWTIVDSETGAKQFGGNNATVAIPTDLTPGTYEVYCEITANLIGASTVKSKIVEIVVKETYDVNFNSNGGTGTMAPVTGISTGSITLPACGFTAPNGKVFAGWALSSNGEIISTATVAVTANITLYAQWEDDLSTPHNIVVNGGTAANSLGGIISQSTQKTTVTIVAGTAPAGQAFEKWEVVSGGVTLADANAMTTTFTMPYADVEIRAIFKNASVTIGDIAFDDVKVGYDRPVHKNVVVTNNGEATLKNVQVTLESGSEHFDLLVHSAFGNMPAGKVEDTSCTIQPKANLAAGVYTAVIKLTADNLANPVIKNVTFTVDELDIYNITFEGSNYTYGGATTVVEKQNYGVRFYPADGYKLDNTCIKVMCGSTEVTGWTLNANNELDVPAAKITGDLTIKVTPIENFTVNFNANGGTGTMTPVTGISTGSITLPACGFTAPAGKKFAGWAWTFDGEIITTATAAVTANSTLFAQWEDDLSTPHNIVVNGGAAANSLGGSITQSTQKATVTIVAGTAPAGQAFEKWEVVSGGVTLADANAMTTTFTMPYADVEIRAIFKNASVTIGDIAFDDVKVGYDRPVHKNVVVTNNGEATLKNVQVTLESGSEHFDLLVHSAFGNMPAGKVEDTSCTIQPKANLAAGVYTAVIKLTADNLANPVIKNVTFVVSENNNGGNNGNNGNDGNNNNNNDNNGGNTGNNGGNTGNKPSDNPQTGDNSMMWLWVALLFVSGFGVVGTTVVRKKKTSVK